MLERPMNVATQAGGVFDDADVPRKPDIEAADWYADIRHQLISSGQTIGELDMVIAAHALSAGAVLVTNNLRHYERVKAPLVLENWT